MDLQLIDVLSAMFMLLGCLIPAHSHICTIGQEKDQHNEWKWVLPYTDLCQCTRIIMGGLNTRTPIRPFVPRYFERPLLSDDIKKIRRFYGLQCEETNVASTKAEILSTPSALVTTLFRHRVSSDSTGTSEQKATSEGKTTTEGENSSSTSTIASTRFRHRVSATSEVENNSVSISSATVQSALPTTPKSTATYTSHFSTNTVSTTQTSSAIPVCYDPLGMENGDIPNDNIIASDESINGENDNRNGYAKEARLNGSSCWRARSFRPWIQADIGYKTSVSGIVTQGDGGVGGTNHQDWVETLKVSTFLRSTNNSEDFIKENGAAKIFTASNDIDTPVTIMFPRPVFAQIVRITCWRAKRDSVVQMRFEILGCKKEIEVELDSNEDD